MNLTEQIKDQYGSLNHFCKLAGIKARTLSVVMAGQGKSQPCIDALIKYNFIKSADKFPQYKKQEAA